MRVFANVPLRTMRGVRGNRCSTFESGYFEVMRLIGPVMVSYERGRRREYIHADVVIPDKLKAHVSVIWRSDGTTRVQVLLSTHRKTLALFLASGDLEWDVREMA